LTTPTSAQDDAPGNRPDATVVIASSRTAPGTTFYALGSPAYRALWINASFMLTALHLGFATHNVVAYDLTGNNSSVGVISFGIGSAILVATPFAGAVADRVSKRLLLFLTQSLILIMALMLSVLLLTDALTLGLMVPAVVMFGTGVAFFWPAITACMGETVEPERQANGAALFQVALNLTRSFAPFVGAGLVAWQVTGFTGAYLAVALVMVGTLISILFITKPGDTPGARGTGDGRHPRTFAGGPNVALDGGETDAAVEPRPGMFSDMKLGLQHVLETRRLLEALVTFIVVILLSFSIMVVLPAFAKDVLGAGNAGFGIMFGTHAMGGLVAGLTVAAKTSSPHLKRYLFVSSVAVGLSISVMALMPSFLLGVVAIFVVGAAIGAFQTLIMASILRAAKPEYFGRVIALTNLGWAMNNLVGLVLGIIADLSSERAALFGVGIVLAIVAVGLAAWSKAEDTPVVPTPLAVS
jgi:predicted MFS family arabinose efflux permease